MQETQMENYEKEILETEKSFAKLAKEKGLKVAFTTFASEEAVLLRENKLIRGKKEIEEYFEKQNLENVQLDWTPDLIDVAASGDLGYTYGQYNFEGLGEKGQIIKSTGIFHTIWKKEANGEWRYVWD